MTFHGLFVGIDRYASPLISDLSCSARDAKALYGLFADTLGSKATTLLVDAQATKAAIVEAFERLVTAAQVRLAWPARRQKKRVATNRQLRVARPVYLFSLGDQTKPPVPESIRSDRAFSAPETDNPKVHDLRRSDEVLHRLHAYPTPPIHDDAYSGDAERGFRAS